MLKPWVIERELSPEEKFVDCHYSDLFEMAAWADLYELEFLIQVYPEKELANTDFDSIVPSGFHYNKEATRRFGKGGFVFSKDWEGMDEKERADFIALPQVEELWKRSYIHSEGGTMEDWIGDGYGIYIYIRVTPEDCQ